MLLKVIAPKEIKKCTIELPPSKSTANRVLIMSALNGLLPDKVLKQPTDTLCDDIRRMVGLLQSNDEIVNAGAAGTTLRFGTAYLAVKEGTRVITGTTRLQERPIGILVDALRTLGADIEYINKEGYPPLRIKGNTEMEGGELTLDGGVSSQFISALLMIAPTLKKGLTLHLVGSLVSTPYINITTELMKQFGAKTEWLDDRTIVVAPGYDYNPEDGFVNIEADWTASSYWYEIAFLSGLSPKDFLASQMNYDSLQGDKVCDSIFELLAKHNESKDLFEYDFEDCPDLVQTFVVACSMNHIPFHFTGLRTLRIKETDRISALQNELAKLGFVIEATDDSMSFMPNQAFPKGRMLNDKSGSKVLPTGEDLGEAIATYNDHRMAMAFAPCALNLGEILIENPEVVTKSYPSYWSDLEKIGFKLSYI